jgi:hypothetical protein
MGANAVVKITEIEMSDYCRFHLSNLGYNFKNRSTGQVISKGEYFDLFGPYQNDDFVLVPYQPDSYIWENVKEVALHFVEVEKIYSDLQQELFTLKF